MHPVAYFYADFDLEVALLVLTAIFPVPDNPDELRCDDLFAEQKQNLLEPFRDRFRKDKLTVECEPANPAVRRSDLTFI